MDRIVQRMANMGRALFLSMITASMAVGFATQIAAAQTAERLSMADARNLETTFERMIARPSGPLKAVCTSTDTKKSCACGDDLCVAGPTNCGCLAIKPKSGSDGDKGALNAALNQTLTTAAGPLESVCSSTDNKQSCVCNGGCIGSTTTCGCITIQGGAGSRD